MKTQLVIIAFLTLTQGCTQKNERKNMEEFKQECYMLVGSYNKACEEGIKLYTFNQETSKTSYICGLKGIDNPSYITVTDDGNNIFAVGENNQERATANSILFEETAKRLSIISSAQTLGADPCFIGCHAVTNKVVTANYTGGSISTFNCDSHGNISLDNIIKYEGSSINLQRQKTPHLHSVNISPDNKYLLATDLGTDNIYIYKLNWKKNNLWIENTSMSTYRMPSGSGPRHLCFHPNGINVYLISELSGEVFNFTFKEGKLDLVESLLADETHAEGSADIHVTPDGKFLYTSHRLKNDGIAIFKIDSISRRLTKIGYQNTGKHPRNFAITPNGNYLLVACKDTNEIQIYRINKRNGLLERVQETVRTNSPSCIKLFFK